MNKAQIVFNMDESSITLTGNWDYHGVAVLPSSLELSDFPNAVPLRLDCAIEKLDSTGVWFIQRYIKFIEAAGFRCVTKGLRSEQAELFDLVLSQKGKIKLPPEDPQSDFLTGIGEESVNKAKNLLAYLAFVGQIFMVFIREWMDPKRIQWRSIAAIVEDTGYHALPIVGLLSFLIGIVLAYQLGLQLRTYGADIFIVNLTGIAILREFGPLITAIIVAGRTSSAHTAQLGMMKLNEEIDALNTMGISPIERLVLPKVVGLIIAMPLLTLWADAFSVFGSMVTAQSMLDINFTDFLTRFSNEIHMKTFWLGVCKAPIFAALISSVGCFQGFQVKYSSESVGSQTTRSVVQAIFLIIIADAAFSILYSELGL